MFPTTLAASSLLLLLLAVGRIRDVRSFTTAPATTSTNIASGGRMTALGAALCRRRGPTTIIPGGVPFIELERFRQRGHLVASTLSMAAITSGDTAPYSAATTSSTSGDDAEYPAASDGEALRTLFSNHCDIDGLLSEEGLRGVPVVKEMLERGELLSSELDEIWRAAPKFPSSAAERIDVDSFVQVYRDIDDLFEDEDEVEDDGAGSVAAVASVDEEEEDEELFQTFAILTGEEKTTISFSQLRKWDEVASMIDEEGVLGEDEFVSLWEGAVSAKGIEGSMDVKGFIRFNGALDELFELEEDAEASEEEEEEEVANVIEEEDVPAPVAVATAPLQTIIDDDLPPGVLFSMIANENYLVGKTELQRWGMLNDMLKDGDLTLDELNALYGNVAKAPGTEDMLDEDGFCALYDAIDGLFEEVDEEEDGEADGPVVAEGGQQTAKPERELKEELIEYIEDVSKLAEDEGLQMCGLDSSDQEQERVLEIVTELEREPYNKVVALTQSGGGAVKKEELVGSWDLIYSSSSTLRYNEGLSGLAGGLTRFGGLSQKLSATKYLSDVEYVEKVVGKLGGNSFDVKITGDWDLRTEVSLFTGRPSNVMSVTPDKVSYGPRSDKADHWKSLGPMNLLVLSYLDEDMRIMRGNTSTDTLFIWRRSG